MVTALNAEIRDLYQFAPEEFTAVRNALAARLRQDKRKDDADEVKALPKPTPSAWAVNVLFERQAHKMSALIAAGKRAREAVSGHGAESPREAIRLARGLVDELRGDAVQILAERGRPPSRDLVERTAANLQAIAFSPAASEEVSRGWLDHDLDPPGFEVLTGMPPAEPPAVGMASRKETRAAGEKQEAAERARREKEVELQRRRIAAAEEKVEHARSEAEPLREEAERLAAEAAEARRAAEKAEQAAAKAQEKADRAAERLALAEEELRELR